MRDEIALYRALKAARDAYRKASTRRNQMRAASLRADAELLSTHADLLAAEASLREAQQ